MTVPGGQELMDALHKSIKEIEQRMAMHTRLIELARGNGMTEPHPETLPETGPSGSRENRMKEAILEAIGILEESRKAFKSKRLEMLRKRLTRVLIETE